MLCENVQWQLKKCIVFFCFCFFEDMILLWKRKTFSTALPLIMLAFGLPLNPQLVMHTCKRNNGKKSTNTNIFYQSGVRGQGKCERRRCKAKLQGRHLLTSRSREDRNKLFIIIEEYISFVYFSIWVKIVVIESLHQKKSVRKP